MCTCSPLTQTNDVTLLRVIQSQQLIDDWRKDFGIDISHELKDNKEVYCYQCNQTKLIFFQPSDVEGTSVLYEKLQNRKGYYMQRKWEHDIAIQDLKHSYKVLEVGAGRGAFIERLRAELGIDARGIELNKSAVQYAEKKEIPVFEQNLQNLADQSNTFDAVCSFQVLEHISNPKEFLSHLIELVKPQGKLILCVPNADSFLKYQYNLLDMPPHHMTKWSEESFKSLETIFPIKINKILREPLASYHVGGYLTAYRTYLCSIYPLLNFFLNRYTLYIAKIILLLGLRKSLTGQSLYVEFHKI